MTSRSSNITWHHNEVSRDDRERVLGQRGRMVWFTGLSGSGKSTISVRVEARLNELGRAVYLLDGDNIRHGLCSDLGFSEPDRRENMRRIGEVGRLFVEAGVIVLAAFISPYRADRLAIRNRVPPGDFVEVFVNTPLAVCEQRDPKGLYQLARAGEIPNFTGISAPYEAPIDPEIDLDTGSLSPDDAAEVVVQSLMAGRFGLERTD
jgi:adenylyl-sulfate kinase